MHMVKSDALSRLSSTPDNLPLKCGRAVGNKFRTIFGDTMREGELHVRGEELFDIRTANIVCLLDLNHSENLHKSGQRRVN